MKFKTKLYASIGVIILLISISVVYLMNMLEQSMVNMHVVVNDLYERIEISTDIKSETDVFTRVGKEMLDNPSVEIDSTAINNWESSNLQINQRIELLKDKDKQDISKELLEKYRILLESYKEAIQQGITIKSIDQNVEIEQKFLDDLDLTRERMLQVTNLLVGLQEQEMKNELLTSRETYNVAVSTIYIYLAITIAAGAGLIILLIRRMTKNLHYVTSVMEGVSESHAEQLPRIDLSIKDEIGSIANAYNKMVAELEIHSQHEKKLLEEAENLSWRQTKITEIVQMYPEAKDLKMLANVFISKIVPMLGASYGAFYIKSSEGEEQLLRRLAAYAFSRNDNRFETFQLGEGLVGQCALEQKPILLNDVPNDYLKIRSGVGESTPTNSMIFPILYEGETLAVVEIASFDIFRDGHVNLLKEVVGTLGITINSISNHMKAERLLQESQSLTEELQVQSEELQMQQEELRTTNEKLEEQYAASEQKKKELEGVKIALEEKAQQLEVSSHYKSEFLANMSHELRTPLNSLLILAQILSENNEGNLTEKQEEYIRTIYTSGNDLLLLINDILDLAKVESGKLEIIHNEVDLDEVKEQLLMQFLPVARQKGLEFKIHLNTDSQNLYNDQHRLLQILNNFLSNAFKFTEKGHVILDIHHEVKETLPRGQRSGNTNQFLAFSVMDTGIGISKEKQETIFEVFRQADGTTSRKYGGTGLGLAISRELASLLGGFIELSSIEGKGSKFTLYLPVQPPKEQIETLASFEEASAGLENDEYSFDVLNEEPTSIMEQENSFLQNKKVLIVDDDIRNVYALTIALEKVEMEIIAAENGYEGIELLQQNPDIDIILMDIMMPEMDGYEAIKRIREMPIYQSLPIIALTAKAMKKSREECLEAGANDYISKPINIDQLFSLMNVWLYQKRG
ncbi:response regulator [Niallia sp. Krafla_26]|uniref:response regulator n=1 Tax=Niallia sp. Krafla_26 TaxID=3064703 RepID=UPI003D174D3E